MAAHVDELVLLTQVARALGLQQRYAEAQGVLDEVAAAPHAPSSAEVQTRLQLERGHVLRSAGDAARAAPRFEDAARSAAAGGLDALLVDATLRLLGRREEALVVQRRLRRELDADGTSDEYVLQELQLLEVAGASPPDPPLP